MILYNVISPYGNVWDIEAKTKKEAMDWAQEKWAEMCSDDAENGEEFEEWATVAGFDTDNPEEVLESEDFLLSYEHYHGDYAEHFNQRDFL